MTGDDDGVEVTSWTMGGLGERVRAVWGELYRV